MPRVMSDASPDSVSRTPFASDGKPRVLVIGGGPAGLMAAETLARHGAGVVVAERMATPSRKFLLAGRGGLNLTHSEALDDFLLRYGEARGRLEPAIRAFPPEALREWADELGGETFVGSSGRVFPKAMKATPLLRAWLARLDALGVEMRARWTWTGWDADGAPTFATPEGERTIDADAVIFALGGASWPRLGGDGRWMQAFADRGVALSPLRASNAGFQVNWSEMFRAKFAGEPLKTVKLSFEGAETRGEAMVTAYGIEGGGIYALSAPLREATARDGAALLTLDLAPQSDAQALTRRLAASAGQSTANRLRRLGLSPVAAGLLRESVDGPALPASAEALAARIKACSIRLSGMAPIERAISTAGGVAWQALSDDFSLKADPLTFVCGEMADWEAPTGGYLLQACFATGRAAALGALAKLDASGQS